MKETEYIFMQQQQTPLLIGEPLPVLLSTTDFSTNSNSGTVAGAQPVAVE